jgi:hypothetical protein
VQDAEAVSVSAGALAAFDYLVQAPAYQSTRIRMTPAQRGELSRLVQLHLEHRLETKLRAPLVIRRLTEPPASGPGRVAPRVTPSRSSG